MHKQDSVQGRPIPEQEQLAWHIDLLHWYVVSSSRLLGVGSLVIRTSFNILPSRCQPLPCGGGCRVMPISTVVNHVNLARCTLELCAYTIFNKGVAVQLVLNHTWWQRSLTLKMLDTAAVSHTKKTSGLPSEAQENEINPQQPSQLPLPASTPV